MIREKLHRKFKSQLSLRDKVELRRNLVQKMDESIREFFHRCIVCQYVICDDYGDSVIGTYLRGYEGYFNIVEVKN